MDFQEQSSNLEQIQAEIINTLSEIAQLMIIVSNNLGEDKSGKKYLSFQQEINKAIINVQKLELRMAIVAPMKAGKSTIINVIVGQELLPSRNAAMTIIPTEIIFNEELTQPLLNLSGEILSIFQEPLREIEKQLQTQGMAKMKEKISHFPYLIDFLQQVQEGFHLRVRTYGRDEIIKSLSFLNDLIRVYSVINPTVDPLGRLTRIPCIETPFWHWQETKQAEQLGNLVIIDTPGPNEAGENLKLNAVVEEQLRQSSIVLIVLDFTQLNNKAAEEINLQVKSVIDLLGKENLYVLVNKIDQRRKGDLTTEQVKEFVFADLGLSKFTDRNRVFEVSAIRAFSATKFMLELQQCPDVALEEMETVEALAQEALGARWESKLKKASLEDLEEEANFLWEDSGFKPFLEKAIKALMANVAPRCLQGALKLARNLLWELKDDLHLRNQAIIQDEERLKTEIEALETDLKSLESSRNRIKEVDKIRLGLQQNLNQILQLLKREAHVSINDYFIIEEYERGDLLQKADIKMRELFLKNLTSFEIFPEWISKNIKSSVEYKTNGVFEFDSEEKAEDFTNHAIAWAKQRTEKLLTKFRLQTDAEIETARDLLSGFLKKETSPIIARAQNRIKENLNVELSLPIPTLESIDEINQVQPVVKTETRYLDQGYEDKLVKKRAWYHWLWLISFYDTERYKKPDVQEDYYVVVLEDLVTSINHSIKASVNQINEELNKYLDEDFKENIQLHFTNLDNYIRNYRYSLKQAQQDQLLSLEEKKKLVAELVNLGTSANSQIKKIDKYLELIDKFKQQQKS